MPSTATGRFRHVQFLISLLLAGPTTAAGQVPFNGAGGTYNVSVASVQELRFHGVVKQERDFSCGSAALATVLTHHYDHPATEHDVFDAMYELGDQEKIRSHGFSLLDMKRYLEKHGYGADGFRLPLEKIRDVGIPAIALLDVDGYKHFVVIKGIRGNQVLVGDPALGLRVMARERFEAQWNGIMFVIHRGVAKERVSFDQESDWAARPVAPVEGALAMPQLANFVLSLPQRHAF